MTPKEISVAEHARRGKKGRKKERRKEVTVQRKQKYYISIRLRKVRFKTAAFLQCESSLNIWIHLDTKTPFFKVNGMSFNTSVITT